MRARVSLDKAGRVVLPKHMRDKLRLEAGDELLVDDQNEQITLRPVRAQASLKKEYGIWVYQGEPADLSIPELLEAQRAKRLGEILE